MAELQRLVAQHRTWASAVPMLTSAGHTGLQLLVFTSAVVNLMNKTKSKIEIHLKKKMFFILKFTRNRQLRLL